MLVLFNFIGILTSIVQTDGGVLHGFVPAEVTTFLALLFIIFENFEYLSKTVVDAAFVVERVDRFDPRSSDLGW